VTKSTSQNALKRLQEADLIVKSSTGSISSKMTHSQSGYVTASWMLNELDLEEGARIRSSPTSLTGAVPKKSSASRSVSTLRVVLGMSETQGDMLCPTSPLF